jgi:hypothetical protein
MRTNAPQQMIHMIFWFSKCVPRKLKNTNDSEIGIARGMVYYFYHVVLISYILRH